MEIDRLGKYEVRGVLGKGAMGTVYSGWDPIISRKVAIKTVRLPDAADIDAQEELARFKREAQAAGRLSHPNIVGVFDYGETEQVAFIVMEFVDGTTLKALVDAGERMAVPQVSRVMADVLAGLSYSHERGVIHRDIKPANIMIAGGDGHGSGQAKIADFGIARIESSNMTQAGTIMGTPAYMSPEQFMGQTVDARTDIYSSGVLLFQLLTGERPFEGSMATIMHKALNTQPPKPSELSVTAPVALDAVVARAMAKRPEQRFATAADFAAALQASLAAPAGLGAGLGDLLGDDADATRVVTNAPKPVASPKPPAPAPAPITRPKSRMPVFAGAAAVVLALAGGGAWFAMSGPASPVNADKPGAAAIAATAAPARIEPPSPPPPQMQTQTASPPSAPAPPPASPPMPPAQVTQVVPPQPAPAPATNRLPTQTLPPVTEAETSTPVPARIMPPATPPEAAAPAVAAVAPIAPAGSSPVAPPSPALTAPTPGPVPPAALPALASTPPSATVSSPTQLASAGLTPEALRRAVAASIATVECAVVGGDAGRGTVNLTGAIGQGQPEQELHRAVEAASGGAAVDWNIGVLQGPYCGVLDVLRTRARPFGAPGPVLQLTTRDGRTSYVEDERIEFRSVLPDFSSYLQIDYFSNDGTVTHMLNGMAGTPVLLGGTSKEVVGSVGTPFGTDLVVSIASSTALFGKGVHLSEKTNDYVRELRTALDDAAHRGSHLAVALLVLKTGPRP